MKKKTQFNIQDLERELSSIADNVGKQETKADLHRWLVRLYKAAAMVAMVQERYDIHPSHNAEEREDERLLLAEIPSALDNLNIYALQALSAPMIKCKKTPRKKCSLVAERRKKR